MQNSLKQGGGRVVVYSELVTVIEVKKKFGSLDKNKIRCLELRHIEMWGSKIPKNQKKKKKKIGLNRCKNRPHWNKTESLGIGRVTFLVYIP